MATLITGAGGFIGSFLVKELAEVTPMTHGDCDLADWEQVKKFKWEGEVVVNCAHYGQYGKDMPETVEKNIRMITNLRRRWPKAKLISFGSGAMYDKSKPIVEAKEYSEAVYPKDLYGLSKRLTVDLSDVTLIPFGVFADTRFVRAVSEWVKKKEPVIIFQEVKFSWVNLTDLPKVIKWAIAKGAGRYNLIGFDMLLSDMAKYLGAKEIIYQNKSLGNEYTGAKNQIKLSSWPSI